MAAPLNHEDLQKLKGFVDFVCSNPTIMNIPQLDFVKKFVENFGGEIPAGDFKMSGSGKCPYAGDSNPTGGDAQDSNNVNESESQSEFESDLELDMEGVIDPDPLTDQRMGDSNKIPNEVELNQSTHLRSQAARAHHEQKYEESIGYYTKAIALNPGNALFHAKRGQSYLKLKKPNACIRDCNKALELNCDSAAAYKFRGRAHRLLGNWELAAKDLRQACKLDFDEETDEWLREVTPNAKKIEQRRIKYERRVAESKVRAQKAPSSVNAQCDAGTDNTGAAFGSCPGFPGAGGMPFGGMPPVMNMNELLSKMKDPEVSVAVQDILLNPNNVSKYASNPKILQLLKDFFPGGVPRDSDSGTCTEDPNSTNDMSNKKKESSNDNESSKNNSDFVDDGLD